MTIAITLTPATSIGNGDWTVTDAEDAAGERSLGVDRAGLMGALFVGSGIARTANMGGVAVSESDVSILDGSGRVADNDVWPRQVLQQYASRANDGSG